MTEKLRVLAAGDSYMPAAIFADALARLGDAVSVTQLQLEGDTDAAAAPADGVREYLGDPAEVAAAVAGHDVLAVHGAPVTAKVLDSAPLRLVCCARGGPVNVDVAAATARGIPVATAPGRNATAVAELTIAFALLLIRAVPAASRGVLDGSPLAASTYEGREFIGTEAEGTTLGIVGVGHVGREVAVRARALGFRVLGYDPVPPPPVPAGVDLVSFDELLSRSDIVSVHARATADNRHMFDTATFARMRPGAYFINTARESLVNEAALLQAVRNRGLAGAAVDVAERPADGFRHPLLDLPNVLVTPHIGGATRETLRRGADLAAAAIAALLAGATLPSLANPEALAQKAVPS
ncbi:MAG TPA: NAD(P)-dependent oxidoreductase [Streptosporangiaceae bacterium]|nr:NAD(P)-dependent oxidoreductase [Streptosporangiaceae bacterium]